MIANTIIKTALRRLQVVSETGEPTTAQYANGLEALNDLVTMWSAQSDMVFEDTLEEIPIAANTKSFTIGPTGDKVTTRPLSIVTASLKDVNNVEYPLGTMDAVQYQTYIQKDVTGIPERLYYRNTFPNGTIYFNLRTFQVFTLILTSIKALTVFPDGTTDISLPPHYEAAFKHNLLIVLAGETGSSKRVTILQKEMAKESKKTVIGQAMDLIASVTELSLPTGYNINGDSY